MRGIAILIIHFLGTILKLIGPGGVRSVVAESLLLKHQLLILNRPRQRAPNLKSSDRVIAGLLTGIIRPARLFRSVGRKNIVRSCGKSINVMQSTQNRVRLDSTTALR
jgi:hypothetical protein